MLFGRAKRYRRVAWTEPYYGFPIILPGGAKSLIEASAIGCPIVTCDSTGCGDVVTDGENGYLIEPRNPEMLADRLRKLIDNPVLRENMGLNARNKAEREFLIDAVVATHLKIYQELSA